ncbi:MAG TPA: GNAT family N-acetyltransferase [Jiangellales bacterium]|nr:GNAT family N-acetyltransferase [Jiangellales bacterium]
MDPYELRDGTVLLSPAVPADADAVTAACQDPQVQEWTTVPSPYVRGDAEDFLGRLVPAGWESGTGTTWAVRDGAGRPLAGMIGLSGIANGSAEVGFWTAPEARGRGLTTAALRLATGHALDPQGLDLQRVVWTAFVGNWASRRVAWRAGYRVEGTVRLGCLQRGRRRDQWVGTVVRGDSLSPATPWLTPVPLAGGRVTLRRFTDGDADAVVEACTDRVSRYWLGGLPDPYTREVALEYVRSREEDAAAGRAVHWAAEPPGGGPALGAFSLMGLDQRPGGAEVGYWVHPAARGTGVATAGVRLLVEHALSPAEQGGLGLRRLVVAHGEGNDASGRVIERTGFRPIGVERAAERLGDGSIVDLRWYDLLLEEARLRPPGAPSRPAAAPGLPGR